MTEDLNALIDQRRALAAQLAGFDLRICMACNDTDGAKRAMREMYAQTVARLASRAVHEARAQ